MTPTPIRVLSMNSKYSDRPKGLAHAVNRVYPQLPAKPTVVLGQEHNGASHKTIRAAYRFEKTIVQFPARVDGYANGTAVVADGELYRKTTAGTQTIYQPPKDGPYETYHGEQRRDWRRFASWATLKERASGKSYSAVSVHGKLGDAGEAQQWENLVALLTELEKAGPVVVGGDWNDTALSGPMNRILKAAGYRLAASLGNSIDSVWVKGFKVLRTKTLDRDKTGPQLDHPVVWVELAFPEDPKPTVSEKVLTWNILGASHTDPARGEHYVKKWAPWDKRVEAQAKAILASGASLGGLQECQAVQQKRLKELLPPTYRWAVGTVSRDNWIYWDSKTWRKIGKTRIVKVPYFGGKEKGMPLILLQHRKTKKRVWVLNCHNPANAKGPAQQYRDEAVRREAAALKAALAEDATVKDFLLLGDFNDPLAEVLKLVQETYPGAHGVGANVDHILARHRTDLSKAVVTRPSSGKASDHPMVVSRLTLDAA